MPIPFDTAATILCAIFALCFLCSFTAIAAASVFNAESLTGLVTKLLGYKELYDIATGNNKSDYGDLIDNVAGNMLGKR